MWLIILYSLIIFSICIPVNNHNASEFQLHQTIELHILVFLIVCPVIRYMEAKFMFMSWNLCSTLVDNLTSPILLSFKNGYKIG